jgi:hypothetical protein
MQEEPVVAVHGTPTLVAGAPAGASYAELHDAFVRSTRSEIAEALLRLLTQLRSGRYPAGRPYRHVNGFTKIVMAEHPSARLTLHYWPAAPGDPDDVSRPHDHRFAFSSILLGGRQHFVELDEAADGTPWRRFTYRPFLQGRVATVRARGMVGLRPFRTVERTPLDGYYQTTSKVIHQAVTQRDQACVTLVLRGPRDRRSSQVYYSPGEPAPRGGFQFGRYLAHDDVVRQVDHALSLVTIM